LPNAPQTTAAATEAPAAAPAANTPATSAASAAGTAVAPDPAFTLKPRSSIGLTPPVDVWDRIRRGFAMPDLDNDLVRNREQWYASRPDYMLRMTERSRPYLFHVVEELERQMQRTHKRIMELNTECPE
jgi:membrane-bound lytic murein transglycosylase D